MTKGLGEGGGQATFSCTQNPIIELYLSTLQAFFIFFFHFFFQFLTTLHTTLHELDYPNTADLVLIVISISPGTSPIKRSYSKSGKIRYKVQAEI